MMMSEKRKQIKREHRLLRLALHRLANAAASACAPRTPENTQLALKKLSLEVERADKVFNDTKY